MDDIIPDKDELEQFYLPPDPPPVSNIVDQAGNSFLTQGRLQSPNFVPNKQGWGVDSAGNAEFRSVNIGGQILNLSSGQSIEAAVAKLTALGGGTINLQPGTYTPTGNIDLPSGISIIGQSPFNTIIDFGTSSKKFTALGTSVYTTGTITSITTGTAVLGSGTSWTANVTAGSSQFFLAGRWHAIAVVTDDTHLTLAEGYSGPAVGAGTAYVIAIPKVNINLSGFQYKGSTGSAIDFDYVRFVNFSGLVNLTSSIGIDLNYFSETFGFETTVVGSTSDAYKLANGGLSSWDKANCVSVGGIGYNLSSLRTMATNDVSIILSTGDGMNLTSCTDIENKNLESSSNGGQGVECISGNDNISFVDPILRNNTSDGLKLTASTDGSRVIGGTITGNGGYGINVAASTCDNNTILAPYFASNTSGKVNDAGTGTIWIQKGIQANRVYLGDSFSAATRYNVTAIGTGAFTPGTNGVSLITGATGTSSISGDFFVDQGVDGMSLYADSPTFSCIAQAPSPTNGTGSSFFGIGLPTVAGAGHTYTVKHAGFKILKVAGVISVYGTQADGSTENATSALTTLAVNDSVEMILVINGTTSIDYYYRKNGGAISAATNLTANMPSGNMGTFRFSSSNNATAFTYNVSVASWSYNR